MSLIFASPWEPRGELNRLLRYYPRLQAIADGLVVALPSESYCAEVEALERLGIAYTFYEGYSGRHRVMSLALTTPADHVQYCDMDRLIRWLELRPDELAQVVQKTQTVDMLIVGRTPYANMTHSRTLTETERVPNMVFSHWFGREIDFAAGSRGFSRRAVELVLGHSTDDNALWMDAAWAVLVRRAGYTWDYVAVDGLDWETADRYLDVAATPQQQADLRAQQDNDPQLWALRAHIAQEITRLGLLALDLPLNTSG